MPARRCRTRTLRDLREGQAPSRVTGCSTRVAVAIAWFHAISDAAKGLGRNGRGVVRLRQLLERAARARGRVTQHVGVDHRGADIAVPEQFLNASDVDPAVEQVSRERMPKRVRGDLLDQASLVCRTGQRSADGLFVLM